MFFKKYFIFQYIFVDCEHNIIYNNLTGRN